MGFFRQEYWSGLLFPSPGNLPKPGIKAGSPALQAILYRLSHLGLANTLLKCRAGASCNQTGRGERAGAGEDETLQGKRGAGLFRELEEEAKVLKGVGSRRP